MYIATLHNTVLGADSTGSLCKIYNIDDINLAIEIDKEEDLKYALNKHLPAVEIEYLEGGLFQAKQDGHYLSACSDRSVAVDRIEPLSWEKFWLIPAEDLEYFLSSYEEKFLKQIDILLKNGSPVKLHLACGLFPIPGFINIDIGNNAAEFSKERPHEFFILPSVGVRFPLPDNVVDFIFHEDFIEHIDQLSQIQFLAEMKRILKPGGVHRVNTPNLIWTMSERSDFDQGFSGVYTGERQWDHISIYSPAHLEEIARMIGYTDIVFNLRGESVSPHAIMDRRPFGDRDEINGNIFADLIK